MSLAHGTNDAQKTMGVISLALIANGSISATNFSVPIWVKLGCALSIALGTATGGWRIINTMGNRITNVESPQGFAAETASAAVILASSYYGYPLSTTQVVSGGVTGGRPRQEGQERALERVRPDGRGLGRDDAGRGPARRCAWAISNIFSPNVGAAVIVALAAVAAFTLWTLAQRNKVTAADLDRTNVSVVDEAEAAGVPAAIATPERRAVTLLAAASTPLIDWSALGGSSSAALIGGVGVVLPFRSPAIRRQA